MGEVELENRSAVPLEIEYTMTPLQFFDMVVTGPNGAVVSEGHFSDRFSPTAEPTKLRLQAGEKFTSTVALLAMVPRAKRRPGVYTIQAVYEYASLRALAEPLQVTV
jgi:hypothetical protein